MKVLIAFFVALAVPQGLLCHDYGVKVKFGLNPLSSFYSIPTTCDEAVAQKWTLEERVDTTYLPVLKLYCYSDKTVCVYFDDTCFYAGIQVAYVKNNLKTCQIDGAADMTERGYKSWTTIIDGILTDLLVISAFTIDQAALDTSATDRINARDNSKVLQYEYITVEGPGGLLKISTKKDVIENEGIFTKQAYIVFMGQHYYYEMTNSTECLSEYLFPWFPLTHKGEMVALGHMMFGQYTFGSGKREWFEFPPRAAVELIVPDGPECLYDLVDTCGISTMHTYFIGNPRTGIILNN